MLALKAGKVILYWVISTALRSNGALRAGGPGKRHLRGSQGEQG